MKCAPHLKRQADAASRLLALAAFTLLAGCSTARPWVNEPAGPGVLEAVVQAAPPTQRGSVVAAMTFSGGGARAAAFGLGVMRELKATPLEWDGRKGTLLDTVGLVSGVSGGSILASYYAAFGDDVFTRFEPDYLRVDFQDRLLTQAVMPNTYGASPRLGMAEATCLQTTWISCIAERRLAMQQPDLVPLCWSSRLPT